MVNNNNFIFGEFDVDEIEKINNLDKIDDDIWSVLLRLNKMLDVGVDFKEIEHTPLSIEARESLIEVLKSFK